MENKKQIITTIIFIITLIVSSILLYLFPPNLEYLAEYATGLFVMAILILGYGILLFLTVIAIPHCSEINIITKILLEIIFIFTTLLLGYYTINGCIDIITYIFFNKGGY